jgi:hypothetical protein
LLFLFAKALRFIPEGLGVSALSLALTAAFLDLPAPPS